MATGTLTGTTIAATYKSILKVKGGANTVLDADPQLIEDGDGNDSVLGISTDSVLISGSGTRLDFNTDGSGEYLSGDGTDLTVGSGADIHLTATLDVNIPVNVGLRFGDGGENIETDNTDFTITSGAKLNLTATSDVHIANATGLVVGHTAQETISIGDGSTDLVPEVQVLGTAQADASLMLAAFSATATAAGAPLIALVKGGNATIGSHTVVTDGEELGNIIAYGDDGTDLEAPAAMIQFEVDGTPGTGDMPGRIVFATTTDGGETLAEQMRITAAGNVGIGVTAPVVGLDIHHDAEVSASFGRADDATNYIQVRTAETQNNIAGIAFQTGSVGLASLATSSFIGEVSGKVTNSGGTLTSDMIFKVNSGDSVIQPLTILSSGNVGIGDTDPSEAKLSITGVASGDAGIKIDQDQNNISLLIDSEATSTYVVHIDSPANAGEHIIAVTDADALTTGGIAQFHSNSSTTGTRNLVQIVNDHSSSTGATVLKLQQDSNQEAFRVAGAGITTSKYVNMEDTTLTTGNLIQAYSNSDDNNPRSLVKIVNDHAGTDNATALYIQQDGNAPAINISGAGMGTGSIVTNVGNVYFGDTANGSMSRGLTINQGANDDEAFALKSSDVAHGRTGAGETDTYFKINKRGATFGGAQLTAIGEATGESMNLQINSKGGAADTTKSASARGLVEFEIAQHDGSNNDANIAANGNVFNVIAYVGGAFRSLFMVDEDGDLYADSGTTTDAVTVWDEYDDAQLIRTLDLSRNNAVGLVKNKFDEFVEYNHEKLAELKIVGREEDGTPNQYLNVTGLQRLHNGAIWQQYTELQKMKELMYDTMVEMLGKEKADAKLKDHDIKLLDNKTLLN